MRWKTIIWLTLLLLQQKKMMAQTNYVWTTLPSLPDEQGFAGMFAGISQGTLFCMGGANFPGKRPWEGGSKQWYAGIYRLGQEGWTRLNDSLPLPLGYGVSVSWRDRIYVIGGSSGTEHSAKVYAFQWNGSTLAKEEVPALPQPLANMAGALVKDLVIVAGGSAHPQGPPLKKCFGLDLTEPQKGWFDLPPWPGPERTLPVCTVAEGKFYLFSGEKTGVNARNENFRYILQDGYCFTPCQVDGRWTGSWKTTAPLPRGASAAGNPLPVLADGSILISGGVDALTALHTDPVSHPGITQSVQLYYPGKDAWQLFLPQVTLPARVTLPVVRWQDRWVYISGEVKPGIRTNSVMAIKDPAAE